MFCVHVYVLILNYWCNYLHVHVGVTQPVSKATTPHVSKATTPRVSKATTPLVSKPTQPSLSNSPFSNLTNFSAEVTSAHLTRGMYRMYYMFGVVCFLVWPLLV